MRTIEGAWSLAFFGGLYQFYGSTARKMGASLWYLGVVKVAHLHCRKSRKITTQVLASAESFAHRRAGTRSPHRTLAPCWVTDAVLN